MIRKSEYKSRGQLFGWHLKSLQLALLSVFSQSNYGRVSFELAQGGKFVVDFKRNMGNFWALTHFHNRPCQNSLNQPNYPSMLWILSAAKRYSSAIATFRNCLIFILSKTEMVSLELQVCSSMHITQSRRNLESSKLQIERF